MVTVMIIHDDDDDLKVNLSGPFANFQRSKFTNVSKLTLSLTWEFEKQAGNLDLCQRSHPGTTCPIHPQLQNSPTYNFVFQNYQNVKFKISPNVCSSTRKI